ncbi:MAG: hydantoinase B/oxoprolinase family protein [Chthoniobacterales bacterium]
MTLPTASRWEFWIDRGGTFTDVVSRAPDGSIMTIKLLSQNPERYGDAAVEGIRQILGVRRGNSIPSDRIEVVKLGTTVATNALLERKGEPTVLVTNRGFKDLLRIGTQQRPRLFDRQIVLPEQIYQRVIEVSGRLTAEGEEIEPLGIAGARASLEQAFAEGSRAVAIVLLHAYRYPAHEKALAALAREVGFVQISTSHETSRLIKVVGRGGTTVVDAYLSPILRRYVDQVHQQLPGVRLLFMQSNGGLTDAHLFQGKDAILSGPAGGIVGAAKVAGKAGFERIICFDMGGTSTDVTHFAGEYERRFETEIAGVQMRVPMMHIHTVAAGGGSICRFDGSRLRVGPESAGADPGPASYRRGGPLTITDCNLMLGRLQPSFFPSIFGPAGNQSLDQEVVERLLSSLALQLGNRSPQDVAEGFLRIAVDSMANAIKKISVARGYDVTVYTLVTFGGAGGQHACAVSDALGIDRILIHPLAGVLSAYGIGLAEIRALRENSVERALDLAGLQAGRAELDRIEAEAQTEIASQHLLAHAVHRRIHLRYQGTDTALAVEEASIEQLAAAFSDLHTSQFGFVMSGRALVIDSVSVEVVARGYSGEEKPASAPADKEPKPESWAKVVFNGAAINTPFYLRENVRAGAIIAGPAILVEKNATTVVEPGWEAEITARLDLILTRVARRAKRVTIGTEVDPVQLEVFNNHFMSIAEQMGVVLQNTAYSVNIKERLDYSCAVFDERGRLVANAPHIPVHLGSMGTAVRAIIKRRGRGVKQGDVYALNDPFAGGTHLPDITVVTPVFEGGDQPLFWVASRGHHADVGGLTPGSMPPASRSIDEEGVLITDLLLIQNGVFRETAFEKLMRTAKYPARNILQNLGDIQAQIAANEKGVQELRVMTRRFGQGVVEAYMEHVRLNAAEQVRRVIDRLKPGSFIQPMDFGAEIRVRIDVDSAARRATIDFAGTSPQLANNFNAPSAIVRAAVLYVFRTLVDDEIPLNDGCLEAIRIIVPEGSMLAPRPPAAVVAGNVETSQAITNALYGALGVLAASQGTMNNLAFGNSQYQYYETICGGAGAGPGFDGASAVHTHMTNSRLTDPEVLELRYPVLVEEFRIRRGSGGKGQWHGGDGTIRRIRFRQPMTVTILASHRIVPPFGLRGGSPGAVGRTFVVRANGQIENLRSCDQTEVRPGDTVVVETPGGGGYGNAGNIGSARA